MSVYRKGTSKNGSWYICVQVAGKKVQCCAHTTDKSVAQGIESAIRQGMRGLPVDKVCDVIRMYLDPTNESSKSASKRRALGLLTRTIEELLNEEKSTVTQRTKLARINTANRLVAWMAETHPKLTCVDDVTPEIAWQFVSSISRTAKTRQNIVGELSAVWNMLLRAGVIQSNPWGVVRPRSVETEQRHGTSFSAEEVARLLDESRRFVQTAKKGFVDASKRLDEPQDTWLTTAILIAVYTGLRQGDVFALTWDKIDLDKRVISITPSKTERFNRRVTIPIHPSLHSHLQGLARRPDGLVLNAPQKPNHAWNLCVERAGIKRGENEMTTFHSLRHTYATWLRDAGAEKGEQMLLGGWTNIDTSNLYDHSIDRLTELVAKLPNSPN